MTEVEFRAIVRYLQPKGLTGAQIIEDLREVYEDESLSKSFVYNWLREFNSGIISVFDERCGGRRTEIWEQQKEEVSLIIRSNR